VTGDPFDRQSLGRAAEVLAASPWVQRVHRVSRRPGGVIEVSATYRQGTALVRTRSGAHLIDAAGVRLPFSYTASEAKATGLAMILGVQQPMPAAGKAWEGEDLAAGLKLAACIVGQSWFGQVAGIDVSNHGGRISDRRAHLRIVTAINGEGEPLNPAGIDWGRPPGEERFFEPTAAWKLRRIATEFAKHGRLDDRVIQVTTEPGLSQRLSTDETVVTATPRL
jgi:hypothetical protein